MLRRAENAAALISAARGSSPGGGQIGLLLADAGYLSEHNVTTPGPDRATDGTDGSPGQNSGHHRDRE